MLQHTVKKVRLLLETQLHRQQDDVVEITPGVPSVARLSVNTKISDLTAESSQCLEVKT